jgi:hypothetical protein
MPKRPQPIELQADHVLTQYGVRLPVGRQFRVDFHRAPRPHERDLSVLAGHLTPRQAAMLVRQEFLSWREAVRYTTVGCLRDAGFRVRSTPSRGIPNHVSVEYDGIWTDDDGVAKRFDDCFGPATWEGGSRG